MPDEHRDDQGHHSHHRENDLLGDREQPGQTACAGDVEIALQLSILSNTLATASEERNSQ